MSEERQNETNKKCEAAADSGAEGAQCFPTQDDVSTAVSQTNNVPQMTTAGSPASHNGNSKWRCEMCTYENFPLSRKCTMCLAAKPSLGEDILRLQEGGASALPSPDHSEADAVAERLRPLRISSPPGQAGASALTKWSCTTCTYENWPRSQRCAMCGDTAPVPVTVPAPLTAHTLRPASSHTKLGTNDICSAEMKRRSNRRTSTDLLWLQACLGVVEGDRSRVEAYLARGGDPARVLTAAEVVLLNRSSAFDPGYTLVHLAIRFQREDILTTLLSRISGGGPGLKRSPSYVSPEMAASIRRHVATTIRTKKGVFPCRYINEFRTFYLPAEIDELPTPIQEQLFTELLDRDAQQTLEGEPPLINWSGEVTDTLGSRLYALWNRSAGDCLPDAVFQAAYGVFDRQNSLRTALAESLHNAARSFYSRWQQWERAQASLLEYTPEEAQLRAEWGRLLAAAARPGTPLHQLHVFGLAHVMRRPIVVYGVEVVNSFRGEALDFARFQGVYLPLLWDEEFCSKSPLCLGYTRGHFTALVPLDPFTNRHTYICRTANELTVHLVLGDFRRPWTPDTLEEFQSDDNEEVAYLPLTDSEGKLLPVHFLTCDEMGDEENIVRRWVSACVTSGGVLCARQVLHERPLLVAQMLSSWLNHYRRCADEMRCPHASTRTQSADVASAAAADSSDPDTDEE